MAADQPCYTLISTGAGEFDLPSEQELKKQLGTYDTGAGDRFSFIRTFFLSFFLNASP